MKVRNTYMDVLGILSCIAVIYLHCSTVVFVNQGDLLWALSIVVQSCFCFAVPVFFMISGANLIGYRSKYDTQTFLTKRIKRVALPLIGFSLLYYLLSCFAPSVFGLGARQFNLFDFGRDVLTNRICDVYWFLYSIIALYAITPLLSLASDNKRLLGYLLTLSFLSTAVIPLINRFALTHDLLSLFVIPYLSGPLFFYLLGYYLERFADHLPIKRWIMVTLGLLSIAGMAFMTLRTNASHTVVSGAFAPFDNFYIHIYNLPCVMFSSCIFLLFRSFEGQFRCIPFFSSGVFRKIAQAPFYVYLIHMLIVNTLDVYVPHRILWDLGLRPLVVTVLAFAFSLVYIPLRTSIVRFARLHVGPGKA